MHDNLHMHVALDMHRLLYIEIAFHITMLICEEGVHIGFQLLASCQAHGSRKGGMIGVGKNRDGAECFGFETKYSAAPSHCQATSRFEIRI